MHKNDSCKPFSIASFFEIRHYTNISSSSLVDIALTLYFHVAKTKTSFDSQIEQSESHKNAIYKIVNQYECGQAVDILSIIIVKMTNLLRMERFARASLMVIIKEPS